MGSVSYARKAPRSAIDWLSNSLEEPRNAKPFVIKPKNRTSRRPSGLKNTKPRRTITSIRPVARILPLINDHGEIILIESISKDAIGLITPEQSGLPSELWNNTLISDAESLINHKIGSRIPTARELYIKTLLVKTRAPLGAHPEARLLLLRLDKLMDIGALDQANALLTQSGIEDASLFRRWFDIGLLTDMATPPCMVMMNNPDFVPTLPAEIFCQARTGNWVNAVDLLHKGSANGQLSYQQDKQISWFLDPQIFEGETPPAAPRPLTALDFTMRSAIALPRGNTRLPAAFSYADIAMDNGLRARLIAHERLVIERALPDQSLFTLYRQNKPAASGGVWDRSAAIRRLEQALFDKDPKHIQAVLKNAYRRLKLAGLESSFARYYGPRLKDHVLHGSDDILYRIYMLSGDYEQAKEYIQTKEQRELLQLMLDPSSIVDSNSEYNEVARSLLKIVPNTHVSFALEQALTNKETGVLLLNSLQLLETNHLGDPERFEAGVFGLASLGLEKEAKAIIVESIILAQGF